MRTGQRLRSHREWLGSPLGSAQPSSTAVHPLATSLLELQRLAGNRAVAAEIGSWRNGRIVIGVSNVDVKTHPSPPPNGVREIRESRGAGGLLGRTVASIDASPPLLHGDAPVKVDKGWTSQARPAHLPEPYLEQWWPTAGLHEMYPHSYLDVSKEWEDRVKAGEDEHVADSTVAWQVTWGAVSRVIAELAAAPGPVQPTEEAAKADLWKRFKAALPADLRPKGNEPSADAQLDAWGPDSTTSLFRRLYGTQARDTRGWHTTTTALDHMKGRDEIRVVGGDPQIGVTSSEDLIAEIRAKVGH